MSSIPLVALQVRPPAADVADRVKNVVSLRDMMNQSQRVQNDQKIWQEAYRANNGDPDKTVAQAIKNGASPESVQTFQQRQAILRQQIALRDELELRNFNTRLENLRGVLKPNADLARSGGETLSHEAGHSAPAAPATPPAVTPAEDPDRIPGTYPEPDMRSVIEDGKQGRQPQDGWPQLGAAGQIGQIQQGQAQVGQTGQAASGGALGQFPGGRGGLQMPRGWTPEKQQLWTKQRNIVLSNPQAYGISDPRQIPEQYPGDDFVLDQFANLGGGQQLVQQDLQRRGGRIAPEGTMVNTPAGMRIKQNGAWVPYAGK